MPEILERDDLTVYVIAGVPRSFKKKLQEFVVQEAKDNGDVYQVDDDFSKWMIARLNDDKRPARQRNSASKALWRAFSALSAARYYLQDETEQEEQVRELRQRVEELWREASPMFEEESEPPADQA